MLQHVNFEAFSSVRVEGERERNQRESAAPAVRIFPLRVVEESRQTGANISRAASSATPRDAPNPCPELLARASRTRWRSATRLTRCRSRATLRQGLVPSVRGNVKGLSEVGFEPTPPEETATLTQRLRPLGHPDGALHLLSRSLGRQRWKAKAGRRNGPSSGDSARLRRTQLLVSIVVSIPACHAGDRGSIPRRGARVSFLNPCTKREPPRSQSEPVGLKRSSPTIGALREEEEEAAAPCYSPLAAATLASVPIPRPFRKSAFACSLSHLRSFSPSTGSPLPSGFSRDTVPMPTIAGSSVRCSTPRSGRPALPQARR
ncbi:uncharacterized protein LOC114909154 [Scleropages formosus]|uniref:uncharacterized protein LOC114909154 n=1 Tax=Scleropages formosus TaxID=113540 RepID=UPI0010FA6CE4|nr:uncharacterized protein LOC114909154 [Scleropages formosus]XP_029101936.1 uncharacterized protein LOC114909154 [Scleropages formosus]XP_029101942.1 uncharacterized protein LOC114909154 [Scleropages formosus]